MILGDIIKEYRQKNHLSLQDFAKLINSSRSYVHMLEKNINPATGKPINPSIETLRLIANAMNMDIEDLLKQLDEEQIIYLDENEFKKQFSKENKGISIPVLGRIPAGIPIEAVEEVLDYEEIPIEMTRGGKEYFGLKIVGDSMYPEYLEDDVLIILKQDDCENGDDCVVMVNGNDATFKRVYKNTDGIILQPLNNTYPPMIYNNKQIEELPVKILGIVDEIRRKKRKK